MTKRLFILIIGVFGLTSFIINQNFIYYISVKGKESSEINKPHTFLRINNDNSFEYRIDYHLHMISVKGTVENNGDTILMYSEYNMKQLPINYKSLLNLGNRSLLKINFISSKLVGEITNDDEVFVYINDSIKYLYNCDSIIYFGPISSVKIENKTRNFNSELINFGERKFRTLYIDFEIKLEYLDYISFDGKKMIKLNRYKYAIYPFNDIFHQNDSIEYFTEIKQKKLKQIMNKSKYNIDF